MPKKSQNESSAPEGDPERGDAILRRMLKSKPKPHKEAVEERKAKRKAQHRTSDKKSNGQK